MLSEYAEVTPLLTTIEATGVLGGMAAFHSAAANRYIWQRRFPATNEEVYSTNNLEIYATGADKYTADPILEVDYAINAGNTAYEFEDGTPYTGISLSDSISITQDLIDNAAGTAEGSAGTNYFFNSDQVIVSGRTATLTDIEGETANTLTTTITQAGTVYYRVVVTAVDGDTDPVYSTLFAYTYTP